MPLRKLSLRRQAAVIVAAEPDCRPAVSPWLDAVAVYDLHEYRVYRIQAQARVHGHEGYQDACRVNVKHDGSIRLICDAHPYPGRRPCPHQPTGSDSEPPGFPNPETAIAEAALHLDRCGFRPAPVAPEPAG